MAVTFVAGSTAVFSTATTVAGTTPAGIADDDVILAAVFGRGTLATLSGWTLLGTTSIFDSTSTPSTWNQRVAVYSKTTVTSADSSTEFTFTQSGASNPDGQRMGLVYQVWRGVDSVAETLTNITSNVDTWSITPTASTASADDTGLAVFASTAYAPGSVTPTPPSSFTLSSGSGLSAYRLAGAYRIVNNGQSNSGAFNLGVGYSTPSVEIGDTNGLGAVVVRLAPATATTLNTYVSAGSPLGVPSVEMETALAVSSSASSPLGSAACTVATDFHDLIEGQPTYSYLDITLSTDVVVRIPMSTWQGTLQTGGQCYLRCSIPAPTDWLDDLTDAVSFTITTATTTHDGQPVEKVIATCPTPQLQTDQGATNYTAQLSGYFDALPTRPEPDPAFYRLIRGTRSTTIYPDSMRARSSVDWIMAPSDVATDSGSMTFTVAYMNLYATDSGEFYMDIGSRAV